MHFAGFDVPYLYLVLEFLGDLCACRGLGGVVLNNVLGAGTIKFTVTATVDGNCHQPHQQPAPLFVGLLPLATILCSPFAGKHLLIFVNFFQVSRIRDNNTFLITRNYNEIRSDYKR